LGRQEKTFEYEVKWQFKSMDSNTWVEKDTLQRVLTVLLFPQK
jgi:hypothetical protein